MNIIPIVLTFDNNMSLPAAVCITSLLMNARENTLYDFYVLYSGKQPIITGLEKIMSRFPNMRIHFRSVGNSFDSAFEIRGITKAAYYRLLAPQLITEYNRVIYTDVDILYKMDLCDIYEMNLGNNYVAAVPALGILSDASGKRYLESIGLNSNNYFVSGFQVMDLEKMRRDELVKHFVDEAKNNYKYQDQDILNIVCKNRIASLNSSFSLGVSAIDILLRDKSNIVDFDIDTAINKSNLHYNGAKPWNDWCPLMDQWWECYRQSPIFDPTLYFGYFFNKLEYLDQLPLYKRIKILIRYFVFGQKKPSYNYL